MKYDYKGADELHSINSIRCNKTTEELLSLMDKLRKDLDECERLSLTHWKESVIRQMVEVNREIKLLKAVA